jgi:hypothetical protein
MQSAGAVAAREDAGGRGFRPLQQLVKVCKQGVRSFSVDYSWIGQAALGSNRIKVDLCLAASTA